MPKLVRYWELAFIAAGSTPAQSEGYRVVEWLEEKYAYVIHCEIEYIFVWSARLVVLTSFEYVTLYFILCTASQITRRHIEYKIYFFIFYTPVHISQRLHHWPIIKQYRMTGTGLQANLPTKDLIWLRKTFIKLLPKMLVFILRKISHQSDP